MRYSPELDNEELEWEVLNKVKLDNLKRQAEGLIIPGGGYLYIGYLYPLFSESNHENSWIKPDEIEKSLAERYDNIICSNPVIVHHIINFNYELSKLSRRIREGFCFLMPYIREKINVFWGSGFSGAEKAGDVHARWYDGEDNQAVIEIYNNDSHIKEAAVSGRLLAFDREASIEIKFGETEPKLYLMTQQLEILEETIRIYPGYNQVSIKYYGDYIQQQQGRRLKFCIENLEIACQDTVYQGEAVYKHSDENGYMKYVLPDDMIRGRLHKNGFFDVSSYAISRNGEIKECLTTGYAESWSEYYVKRRNEISETSELLLYIARRKGRRIDG